MENLKTQLKDLAMSMTQDEYIEFVYQTHREANDEKLRVSIEQIKRELPDLVKVGEKNTKRLLQYMQKDYEEYIERLKAENERLKEDLKNNPIDYSQIKPPKKLRY